MQFLSMVPELLTLLMIVMFKMMLLLHVLLPYEKLKTYLLCVMTHQSRHQRVCVAFVTMILPLITCLLGSRVLNDGIYCGL